MFRTRRIIQLSTNLVRRLSNKSCNLMNYNISLSQKLGQPRNIHTSSLLKGTSTYEGEGKTTVHILNNEADLAIMINGVSQVGFRLNNEMTVLGPMLIFPRSVLSWNVASVNDINEDSLAIFSILEPKVDILVLGVGDAIEDTSIYRRLLPLAHKLRLSMEILPTEQACSTFNFLASEGRFAVGALIPPKTLIASDDDIVQTKLRYQNIYEIDEPYLYRGHKPPSGHKPVIAESAARGELLVLVRGGYCSLASCTRSAHCDAAISRSPSSLAAGPRTSARTDIALIFPSHTRARTHTTAKVEGKGNKQSRGLRVLWLPGRRHGHKHSKAAQQQHQHHHPHVDSTSRHSIMASDSSPTGEYKEFSYTTPGGRSTPPPTTSYLSARQESQAIAIDQNIAKPAPDNPEKQDDLKEKEQKDKDKDDVDAGGPDANPGYKPEERKDEKRDQKDGGGDKEAKLNGGGKLETQFMLPLDAKDPDDEVDDSCAVNCLYYTMQCCECVIT